MEPLGVHSWGALPRVSIHFVSYLRHSRGYPFILYAIYIIPAGIHSFCILFHHSRGYPLILCAIYIIPAGIHSFCMLFTLFPRVSIYFVRYLRHSRGYAAGVLMQWSIGKCLNVFFASGSASPAFALVSLTLPLRLHLQNVNMI